MERRTTLSPQSATGVASKNFLPSIRSHTTTASRTSRAQQQQQAHGRPTPRSRSRRWQAAIAVLMRTKRHRGAVSAKFSAHDGLEPHAGDGHHTDRGGQCTAPSTPGRARRGRCSLQHERCQQRLRQRRRGQFFRDRQERARARLRFRNASGGAYDAISDDIENPVQRQGPAIPPAIIAHQLRACIFDSACRIVRSTSVRKCRAAPSNKRQPSASVMTRTLQLLTTTTTPADDERSWPRAGPRLKTRTVTTRTLRLTDGHPTTRTLTTHPCSGRHEPAADNTHPRHAHPAADQAQPLTPRTRTTLTAADGTNPLADGAAARLTTRSAAQTAP